MSTFKKLALATATAGMIALTPLALHAEDDHLRQQLTEARQEGSIWTAIALNRNLGAFDISVDVNGDTAVLTGSVESDVERDLAEQLALGVDGIARVDNQVTVDAEADRGDTESQSDFSRRVQDATITATVKSKLLWNSNTNGMDINVETSGGVVTLNGTAPSDASRDLAENLAENTDNVRRVENNLQVSADGAHRDRDDRTDGRTAGDTVNDTWITSKVKSSYLFNRNLSGMDIEVETNNGQVTLAGEVANDTEKALAVEVAENIRGVNGVNADRLAVRN